MRHEEDKLQQSCIRWFDYQHPKLSLLLHHSPNGGFRNKIEAAKFKLMGVRKGFPDLILLVSSNGYHALMIELKSSKGRQQESQKLFQQAVEAQGYKYALCYSLDEFITIINEYLKFKD